MNEEIEEAVKTGHAFLDGKCIFLENIVVDKKIHILKMIFDSLGGQVFRLKVFFEQLHILSIYFADPLALLLIYLIFFIEITIHMFIHLRIVVDMAPLFVFIMRAVILI